MAPKKPKKIKKQHVKVLAKMSIPSKKSSEKVLDPCDISCTDGCKPLCKDNCKSTCQDTKQPSCQTSCKITCMDICQNTVQTPSHTNPPEDNPCNTTGVRAPGGPILKKSKKADATKKTIRKK